MEGREVRCRAIIEILGKPKGHVEESLRKYIELIEKEESIRVVKKDIAEAEEREDVQEGMKYFATFVELEFLIKDISKLGPFCFNYMPSSIEILEPEHLILKNVDFSDILNDLQARSHNVDKAVKELKSENEFLKRNMQTLLKNAILISLRINSLSLNRLARATGIKEKELTGYLEELIKEKKIEKEGELYCLKQI